MVLFFVALVSGCMVAPYTKYMASAVSGQVLKAGRPIKGAIVTREAAVQGKQEDEEIQRAVTDENGRVSLPDMTRQGVIQSIATWVYTQKYLVEVEGKTYVMCEEGKVGAERFSEQWLSHFLKFDGDKSIFTFDIDAQKKPNQPPATVFGK